MVGETTTAPTSGITKSAAEIANDKKARLSEAEFDFVNILHQHYNVHGVLVSSELALEKYGIPVKQYTAFMKNKLVLTAVGERDIPLREQQVEDQAWRNNALSARQIIVANTMLDLLDQRSYKKKLQDLDVKTTEWQAWLKEPEFARYLDENTQAVLKNGQHEAALAIMDGVSRGDYKFIQLYWEYTGRFIPKDRNALNPVSDAIDAKRILQSVVEIIIDEVEDHQIASRIADRLKTLMTAVQVTNGLLGTNSESGPVGDLEMPEVVPTRALTPAMNKAVDQGIGMET